MQIETNFEIGDIVVFGPQAEDWFEGELPFDYRGRITDGKHGLFDVEIVDPDYFDGDEPLGPVNYLDVPANVLELA